MLALCLMFLKTNYAQYYAGIIGLSLRTSQTFASYFATVIEINIEKDQYTVL